MLLSAIIHLSLNLNNWKLSALVDFRYSKLKKIKDEIQNLSFNSCQQLRHTWKL